MPPVSSDTHAWLRPIYAQLRNESAFAHLSTFHQFDALCKAAAAVSPSKVALMRQFNATTQAMLLDLLANAYRDHRSETREVELWRVRKGDRELWCHAVYLPTGIDMRLMEGDGFRRTQLVRDAPAVSVRAVDWLAALIERGWGTL